MANTRDWVSLKLKWPVLGQNWKENNCLRHQNISEPLDGIDGLKAFDKTLLEVSAKKGEAKSNKELKKISTAHVLIMTKNLESLLYSTTLVPFIVGVLIRSTPEKRAKLQPTHPIINHRCPC